MDEKAISVLLVERDKQALKSIMKVLHSSPRIQMIELVDNGLEAVAKATTRRPDVVLMNVSLETDVTGIYVCKEIRANVTDTKVVLYGKNCDKGIILQAFQMGTINFLAGEYSKRELLRAVLDAADDRSPIHQSSADLLRREFKYIMDLQENQTYIVNVLVKLTPTEITILRHFYNGMTGKDISKLLFISNATMKTHITHILRKFNLENMKQVVAVLNSTELFSLIDPNNGEA